MLPTEPSGGVERATSTIKLNDSGPEGADQGGKGFAERRREPDGGQVVAPAGAGGDDGDRGPGAGRGADEAQPGHDGEGGAEDEQRARPGDPLEARRDPGSGHGLPEEDDVGLQRATPAPP